MSNTASIVSSVYQAVVRTSASSAYSTAVAAQIDDGAITLNQYEGELLSQVQSTTFPALVLYNAFYGSTENSGGLDYVTAEATQLADAGATTEAVYSTMGSWFALGSNNFSTLYSTAVDDTTFVQSVYQNIYGQLPPAAALNYLLSSLHSYYQSAQAAGLPNAELLARGSVYGDLLWMAQSSSTGSYAAGANVFMSTLVTDAENSTPPTIYGQTLQSLAPQVPHNAYLTTGADNVTANNIFGSLTPFTTDGVGPTLNSTDIINGTPGSSNNTLTIGDGSNAVADTIPVGTTINNVQNVVLNTQANAGGGPLFDTSGYSSVTNVTINSTGSGLDNVKVGAATALTVNHQNVTAGGVSTYGGSNVAVTVAGGAGVIAVGSATVAGANPGGAVTVTQNGTGAVTVLGGTTVTVTDAAAAGGAVTIGVNGPSLSPGEPTGAVTVTTTTPNPGAAATAINIFGGTNATVNAAGGAIAIGSPIPASKTVNAPTGNDSVTDTAGVAWSKDFISGAVTGVNAAITILGGVNDSVTTNTSNVQVGGATFNGTSLIAGQSPSGSVNVSDTSDLGSVTVFSGAGVTISAAGGAVTVGSSNGTGTQVVTPTGPVTVTDAAPQVYDGLVNTTPNAVTALGGSNVSVTTNAGSATVGNANGFAGTLPTGTINVTDTATGPGNDNVNVYGGTNDTVNLAGGQAVIGNGTTATNPTGTVTVTQSAVETGGQYANNSQVVVNGGAATTVTTTGGNVYAGTNPGGNIATPVTGAVAITDTFIGPNVDKFTVLGGTTINVTTTATSGLINLGATPPVLDSTGTKLANASSYASGAVVVSNESLAGSPAAGSTAVFGQGGPITVNTNGATSVTIAGGTAAAITDEQTTKATGGANAGQAIGPSTLATVMLDGTGGATTITSDALANLSVADSPKTSPSAVTVTETPKHALALTLSNDVKGTSISDNSATSITVIDAGAKSNEFALNAAKASALTINNAAPLTLDASTLPALGMITASGAGSLALGSLSGGAFSNLAMINAAASSGAVSVTLDPTVTSFTGGSGNATVTLVQNSTVNAATPSVNDKIVAGTGPSSTIVANYAASATDKALGTNANIKGFSTLGLGTAATSGAGNNPYDATNFGALTVGAVAGNVLFSNVASGTALAVTASPTHTVSYSLVDTTGKNDSLPLTVGVDGAQGSKGVQAGLNLVDGNAVAGSGYGLVNLNITSVGLTGSPTAITNTVNILDQIQNHANTGSAAQHVTITGDTALTLNYIPGAGPSSITSINASNSSAAANVTGVQLSSSGATITGGGGLLTAQGSGAVSTGTNGADDFVTGSGGGKLTLGYGGAWNTAAKAYTTGGSETVNLTNSTAVSDTLVVQPGVTANNTSGTLGGITGFQAIVGSAADVLALTASHSVVANVTSFAAIPHPTNYVADVGLIDPSGALATDLGNMTYKVSNGMITFGATGIHNVSQFSTSDFIAAAEAIVTQAAEATGQEQIVGFTSGGSTYVVASDAFNANPADLNNDHMYGSAVLDLVNLTGITGFGITGAGGVIDTTNVALALPNGGLGNLGSAAGATYDDTGFSADVLTTGGKGVTNTFNNLSAAAQIQVAGAGDLGNVVVTQLGSSGQESFSLTFMAPGSTLDSLTTSGDAGLFVTANLSDTITSIVDATNTVTTLTVAGAFNTSVTIGGITDTALTAVSAGSDLGSLTVTAAQSGLTVTGALGGDNVTAAGAGDTITVGSATHTIDPGAVVNITANGAGDTIAVIDHVSSTDITAINAAAAGDTIGVDGGSNAIGGTVNFAAIPPVTLAALTHALGANDTINLGSGNAFGSNLNATDLVWAGSNSTVNLGTSHTPWGSGTGMDSANVNVSGDLTGATSSGSYAVETVSGFATAGANGSLNLHFANANNIGGPLAFEGFATGSAATALVNTASAATLANALDLAASQAVVMDAQALGGAHTTVTGGQVLENGNTGLMSWFQFGGNTYVVDAINNNSVGGSAGAAAHSGLGTGDVVVELVGLVDVAHNAHLTFA